MIQLTPNQQKLADALKTAYRAGELNFDEPIETLQCTNHYGAVYGVATVCMSYVQAHPVKFGRGKVVRQDYMTVCELIFADVITFWYMVNR